MLAIFFIPNWNLLTQLDWAFLLPNWDNLIVNLDLVSSIRNYQSLIHQLDLFVFTSTILFHETLTIIKLTILFNQFRIDFYNF